MEKLDLKRITVICIDGRELTNEDIEHHRVLANHMLSIANYGAFKMFMSRPIEIPGANVSILDHSFRGYVGYSKFCISELYKHIDTEYVLLYHSDSFILNPELWSDDFLKYDYIGAPWPLYMGWPTEGNQVGNGGFSIRTKRLHELIKNYRHGSENEDTFIVGTHKQDLINNGFTIAPVDVAKRFSLENPMDESHNIDTVFGFHAKRYLDEAMKKIRK